MAQLNDVGYFTVEVKAFECFVMIECCPSQQCVLSVFQRHDLIRCLLLLTLLLFHCSSSCIQLGQVQLTFATPPTEELIIRVELEIQNAPDAFKWDGSSTNIYRTENIKPTQQSRQRASEKDGVKDAAVMYSIGFNGGLYKRSAYLSLDSETTCSLVNAKLNMRCILVREPVIVADPVPLKKGAPPPVAVILEELVTELSLPFSSLLTARGSAIQGSYFLDNESLSENVPNYELRSETAKTGLGALLVGHESFFSFKIAADNDLAVSAVHVLCTYCVVLCTYCVVLCTYCVVLCTTQRTCL